MRVYCETCVKSDVCCYRVEYNQTVIKIRDMNINPTFKFGMKCDCYREDITLTRKSVKPDTAIASYRPIPGVTESSVMECTSPSSVRDFPEFTGKDKYPSAPLPSLGV